MLLSDQIAKLDHRLSAILDSNERSFQQCLAGELRDLEERWNLSFPRGFKTSFAKSCSDIAQRKSLAKLRESAAKSIEDALRALDAIEHDMSAILRVESPKYADEVAREIGLDDEAVKCLSDEGFVTFLDKGRHIRDESKRLVYYLQVVKSLSSSLEKAQDRIAKLSTRIKSDSGAESAAAIVLKKKISAVAELLWQRREVAARLFFLQRRKLLTRLVSATAAFDLSWKSPSQSLASLVKEKNVEIETPLRLLSAMDATHRNVPSKTMAAMQKEVR